MAQPLEKDLKRVLISEEEIEKRVDEIASLVNRDYKDITSPLVIVGVLKGSLYFLSDLSRKITVPSIIDFIAVTSYGKGGDKRGEVRFLMDTRESITDRHVLIIEDILDSGHTLEYLETTFRARHPLSLKKAAFLDKNERHETDIKIDYKGFDIPDVWVVGYGLDYKEEYRSLPYIAEMISRE